MSLQDSQSEQEGSVAPSALVKKAAAAMAVGVGSFKDPDQLQVCSLQAACGQTSPHITCGQGHIHSIHRYILLVWMFMLGIRVRLYNAGIESLLGTHVVHGQQKVSRRKRV